MGLNGYRLWVMGQLYSNVQRPTTATARMTTPNTQLHVASCFCLFYGFSFPNNKRIICVVWVLGVVR
jgi:hypothetical protein